MAVDGAVAQEHAVHVDVEHLFPGVDRIIASGTLGPVMPAEQISASMLPKAAAVVSTARATASASLTSSATDRVSPPICALASSRAFGSRSQSAIRAPLATMRRATASPMPAAPPVMAAVLPLKSSWFIVRLRQPVALKKCRGAQERLCTLEEHQSDDQGSDGKHAENADQRKQRVLRLAMKDQQVVDELRDLCVRRRSRLRDHIRHCRVVAARFRDVDWKDKRKIRDQQRAMRNRVPIFGALASPHFVAMPGLGAGYAFAGIDEELGRQTPVTTRSAPTCRIWRPTSQC
jgi:hypothetical protein